MTFGYFSNSLKLRHGLAASLAVGLALLWLVAAFSKTRTLDELTEMLKVLLPILGTHSIWVAVTFVGLEALMGIALIFRKTRQFGLYGSAILAGGLLAVNALRYVEGINAPCSCFGALYTMSPSVGLGLTLAMTLTSAWALTLNEEAHVDKITT